MSKTTWAMAKFLLLLNRSNNGCDPRPPAPVEVLAPLAVAMIVLRKITLLEGVVIGVTVGALALTATVLLDSMFWRRYLWPALVGPRVLRSSRGVSPGHGRACHCLEPVSMKVIGHSVALCDAQSSGKGRSANYPGGHALGRLHSLHLQGAAAAAAGHLPREAIPEVLEVHIDNLPAMTGVSRFGELPFPWKYSKQEGLAQEDLQLHNFTYLLRAISEDAEVHETSLRRSSSGDCEKRSQFSGKLFGLTGVKGALCSEAREVPGYTCISAVNGFQRLQIERGAPFIKVATTPQVFVQAVNHLRGLNHYYEQEFGYAC
eukprot:gene6247-7490_t